MSASVRLASAVALVFVLTCQPEAHAGWIGSTTTGSLTPSASPSGFVVTTDFSSPQTVGAGIEFQGEFHDASIFRWVATADVGDDTITIRFHDPLHPDANVFTFLSGIVDIDIGGLTGASGMALLNFSCLPAGFPCNVGGGNPEATYSSTGTSFHASFSFLRSGDTYVFGLGNTVPEPGSFGLAALAMAGLGVAASRRRS